MEFEYLIPIVKKLSAKYTSNESSSITYEVAEQLMEAVIYCIEENLRSSQNSSQTEILNSQDIESIYHKGYDMVLNKAIESKKLYENIILNFESYKNICYYDTIIKGIPNFFIYYDAKFNPQNHILTLDYPTLEHLENSCGVDLIYKYLVCTHLEQIFLSAFPNDYIVHILKQFNKDYRLLIINICSIVMRNIICSIIIKNDLNYSGLGDGDISYAKELGNNTSNRELEKIFTNALKILIDKKYDGNQNLFLYLKQDIKEFIVEFKNAAENDCMRNILSL